MDVEILALASAADGLAVTVGRTPIGTFRVVFRDTDADAIIETRVFTDRERAIGFARGLIAQGSAVQTLILRTVDGEDTLCVTEHPCADARAMLALLAAGRRVARTGWCGSTLEADVSVV